MKLRNRFKPKKNKTFKRWKIKDKRQKRYNK